MTYQHPIYPPVGDRRIAIVVDCPVQQDILHGQLLAGKAGAIFKSLLDRAGIVIDQCLIAAVTCKSLPGYRLHPAIWDDLVDDMEQLRTTLTAFRPSMVLCLGDASLQLMKEGAAKPFKLPSVLKHRGSMFVSKWLPGVKCMSTIHPQALCVEYDLTAYVRFDLQRLATESKSRTLEVPEKLVVTYREKDAALAVLKAYREAKKPIATDIEGYLGRVSCISFADSASGAIVIPFSKLDRTAVWNEEDELILWQAIKELLEDPEVPKILQNGLYDAFVLAWTYGIVMHNFADDTMLKWWEMYAELKKGLATQTSILTKEPYYKPSREDDDEGGKKLSFQDDEAAWRYCGIDSAVTFECNSRLNEMLTEGQQEHYRFNMALMPAVLYMELKGMKWDSEAAARERRLALSEAFRLQAMIDEAAGVVVPLEDEAALASACMKALAGKSPKVTSFEEVTFFQPLKANAKGKLVKDGKLVDKVPLGTPFKTVPRTVRVRSTPDPKTLDECRPFILASKLQTYNDLITAYEIYRILENARRRDAHGYGESSSDEFSYLGGNKMSQASASGTGSDQRGIDSVGDRFGRIIKNASQSETGNRGQSSDSRESDPCADMQSIRGRIGTLLGVSLNVGSTQADGPAQRFLYDTLGLDIIFKKEKGKLTDAASSDQNALTALYAKSQDIRVLWVLQLRRLRKLASDLETEVDEDGRIRSSLSLVKETGRMAASKSPTGKGANLQALNKSLRHLCLADDGYEFFQRDLEGADSWTVAAECAALGDDTMLKDLLAGLKPAKVLCLLYLYGVEVNGWSRDDIKAKLKAIKMEPWLYPGAKASVHGSSYGMGIPTMIQTVLRNSMKDLPLKLEDTKPALLTHQQGKALQEAFFLRYSGVKKWHRKWEAILLSDGCLTTAQGHIRRFYGRKREYKMGRWVANNSTLKEALASYPQFITTYATKRALLACWQDGENRRPDGTLRSEPIYCVHDSFLSQHRIEDAEWVEAKEAAWFNNTLKVAGIDIVIPTDFQRGKDWSMK